MRIEIRYLTPLLAAVGVSAAVLLAPVAAAAPECTNTGPNTTQCQTRGSTQIVTSPPAFDQSMVGLAVRRLRLRHRHRILSSQETGGNTPHGVCEPYYLCDRDGVSWDFSRERD